MEPNLFHDNNKDEGGGKTQTLVKFFCGDIMWRDVKETFFFKTLS